MKKRTSNMSRRIVSLLMSMVLTLTLVTPAAFATEVVDGSGTTIVEGDTNPADANPSEDSEGGDSEDDEIITDEEDTDGSDSYDVQEDTLLGISLYAADAWDGTVDTDWYANAEDGTGTADKPYEISTAAQLAGLAKLVNGTAKDSDEKPIPTVTFSGKFIKLTADVLLNELNEDGMPRAAEGQAEAYKWTPIGNSAQKKFQGTFDGDGYTVSGVYIKADKANFQGLFGFSTGTVKNLIVTGNITATNAMNIGGVVGINNNNGNVINCGFYGGINKTSNKANCGGVVGGGTAANVKNCWFYKTDGNVPESDVVGTKGASNCAGITEKGSDLTTVNTNIDCNNKVWIWTEDKPYPVLGAAAKKTITFEAVFPDCKVKFTVMEGETLIEPSDDGKYEVTEDSVILKTATENIYVAASPESNDLLPIKPDGTSYEVAKSVKLYYGTKADFEDYAAWQIVNKTRRITDESQLKLLARMVKNDRCNAASMSFSLGESITLSGDWEPIGTPARPFAGAFNGAGASYSISGLNGDLFGVVNGTIESVNISGGTGRLVETLKSGGTVKDCMSTAAVTGGIGGLIGTAEDGTTVSSSYYYNTECKGTTVVGGGKAANCFYLAETSTFGDAEDNGARTAEEFAAGRVTWELNGKANSVGQAVRWSMADGKPVRTFITERRTIGRVYELTLTKIYAPQGKDIELKGDGGVTVLHNGDTWYAYCIWDGKTTFSVTVDTTALESEDVVSYGDNGEPKTIKGLDLPNMSSQNTYSYSIGKKLEADISWYVGHESDLEYTLTTAAQMFGFAALVNGTAKTVEGTVIPRQDFTGRTVKLGKNIDLSGYLWTQIGPATNSTFNGTFDGCGMQIEGVFVTSDSQATGLFKYLEGIVRNVQVEGSVNANYTGGGISYVGGIVGLLKSGGAVQNCLSRVNVTATGAVGYVGGVVGNGYNGKVNLCWNEGIVQGTDKDQVYANVGGICGGGNVTNCANFGTVVSNVAAGGIVGGGTVSNSYNLGNVTGAEGQTYGISGGTVSNSYYVCEVNSTLTQEYINGSEIVPITVAEAANGKTYMAGNAKLVDMLNSRHESDEWWITNLEKNVFLPRHATMWSGETDIDCTFKTVTVTYDPNGGVNKDGSSAPVTVSEMIYVVGEDVIVDPARHIVLSIDDENLGFKHENGNIKEISWNTEANGSGTGYAAEDTIVELTNDITLYAQWNMIWDGMGTADEPYQIPNTEKFKALQAQVNEKNFSYKDRYFEITGNIDLANEAWTPIGSGKVIFCGSIEGNGNTIRGLNVDVKGNAGLFGALNAPHTNTYIRNLTIEGTVKSASGNAGGLTADLRIGSITLENITTNVAVTVVQSMSDTNYAGGLVGFADSVNGIPGVHLREYYIQIIGCTNNGAVSGPYAGGIAGGDRQSSTAQYSLEKCVNNGTVTGTSYAGGLLGYSNIGKANSCENRGTVTASGTGSHAGGISGMGLATAERCANFGAVSGTFAAGITYELPSSGRAGKAVYCRNEGAITGKNIAAGIVVYSNYRAMTGHGVSFSCNLGKIEAPKPYGIALGGAISNCFTYNVEAESPVLTASGNRNVTNSYYLADSKNAFSAGEWASAADFASGKVAWGVDGGEGAHAGWWTQDTEKGYPKLLSVADKAQSYYRAMVQYGTGGTASLEANSHSSENQENAVYGMKGTSVTVTATPKDETFGLKSLTLDLMGTGSTTALESGDSFTLGEANALVVAAFASTGNGGSGDGTGGNGGDGDGTGTDTGDGAGDENDEGLQDGLNLEVEYDVKGLVLAAYGAWGAEGSGKTFTQWLKDSPEVLRALIANSLDNMAVAAMGKKTDEAKDLAAMLLASLNEHSGLNSKNGDIIGKALQRYMDTGSEATFSAWLTTGGGMASGTYESIFAQYTNSLLALTDRLYTSWESSGTALTFPQWLDAQQVSMESLSENANEPDTDTDDTQTSEAPEEVPDGQESEGGASGGGNSVWEVIGTVVRENPIIVWAIVAVVAALIIVGAVRRYRKVKRDEHDDVTSKK